MDYDLTIERHQIAKAAGEHGWGRISTPYWDHLIWPRDGAEETSITVYFDESAGAVREASYTSRLGHAEYAGPINVEQVLELLLGKSPEDLGMKGAKR